MKKALPALLAVTALLVTLWWYYQPAGQSIAAQSPRPAPVTLYTVQPSSLRDRIEALGTLLGNESITITANTTETVADIHFQEGQRVQAGDLLVSLSQAEERAQLAAARSDVAEQQREVRRLEGLIRSHATAQTELDQRRTALDKARHKIDELEAVLADLNLRAPFAGVVGFRQVSPGALVAPGTTITTLDDIGTLKLEFSVPETLLASLNIGQSISAYNAALDRTFEGQVYGIDSRVDPVERSIKARARFDNADGLLKPGMLMTMVLHARPRQVILIPEESLVSRGDHHEVWAYDADTGTVSARTVNTGSRQPGWVEITEGLKAGEQVVRNGLGRLRPGLPVTVLADNPSAAD